MKVWATWHGGDSYSVGIIEDNLEVFDSLEAAKEALVSREAHGDWMRQTFRYADGRVAHVYCPGVDNSELFVYFGDPRGDCDPYPDRIISIGPRGGVRVQRC
jgi:hypothetical protein